MAFSNKLKELRLQNNLSQEKLAKELDTTRRTYIYYETGQKNPSGELLSRVAKFFKVDISFLMDEQNESIANEQTQKSIRGILKANQLVDEISGLFEGEELSETEKDTVMEALQGAYWNAKKKNR